MRTNFIPDRRTFKTTDDFLRWLEKRKADKKLHQSAMMVWADDGGRNGETTEDGRPNPRGFG